jgi:uncharacterized protein YjbI with pentapeptide repeats
MASTAKIVVEPRFYFPEGGIDFFMKDVVNSEEVNTKIIELLQPLFPDLPINRNAMTNLYFIDSRVHTLTTSALADLYQKIRVFNQGNPEQISIDTVIQGHSTINTSLRFNFFDQFPEGLTNISGDPLDDIAEITDEDLSDEEFRRQIIENGADLSNLNYENHNPLDDVYFVQNVFLLGANFSDSDIDSAELIKAHLICANFTNAVINQTNFTNADLRYADFSHIKNAYETYFSDADLRHAKFVGTDIASPEFNQSNLKNSDCRGAIFIRGDFTDADLTGADLTDADFRNTELTNTIFTGCILTNTKFHGSNWEDSIYDDAMDNADVNTVYVDAYAEEPAQGAPAPGEILPSLPLINPYAFINNSKFTYSDVLKMLNPSIKNVVLQVSKMEVNKWYRVSELGDTPNEMWAAIGVPWKTDADNKIIEPKTPSMEKAFKCLQVPAESVCEGFVYDSTPDCMAVHELSRKLNVPKLMENFSLIVGNKEIIKEIKKQYTSTTNSELVQRFMAILKETLDDLLQLHNAEDGVNGWTSVYDTVANRNKFINHALYHAEEGLINQHMFNADSTPIFIVYLIMFLNTLPLQMRVYWAQNYILQFITGYGQTLENFNPTRHMPPYNFIASCLGGNLEKFFLSIGTAIAHYIDGKLIVETEEEQKENLKRVLTKNVEAEFEKYYGTTEDPTIEGYEEYLSQKEITGDFTTDIKSQYIDILKTDPVIRSKLKCFVHRISGGGKKRKTRRRKQNKPISKKHTLKKHTLKKHTLKKHTLKKHTLKKHTLKKNKLNKKKNKKTKKRLFTKKEIQNTYV